MAFPSGDFWAIVVRVSPSANLTVIRAGPAPPIKEESLSMHLCTRSVWEMLAGCRPGRCEGYVEGGDRAIDRAELTSILDKDQGWEGVFD